MSFLTFEPGDTRQFTWVASVAPDAAPRLAMYGLDGATVVISVTAQSSDTTHYWTVVTMPATEGHYRAEWIAQKTAVGSTFQLLTPLIVQVRQTRSP
jgi:hypothetical protein